MLEKTPEIGLTFDDVLVVPAYSEIHPNDVSVKTRLSRQISLNIPLLSAAMDTITESRLAIALAQQGGLGVIHKNMGVSEQAEEVDKVKRSESGMIVDPITIAPDAYVYQAEDLMHKYRISGVPVTASGKSGGKLVGILTNRDLRFETRSDIKVQDIMTKENLVTVPVGTTLEDAKRILHKHKIEKLLVVDEEFHLRGLITVKDIEKKIQYPLACKDDLGRLRVGAAIGVASDMEERADELIRKNVDILVLDSSHGHSAGVLESTRILKKKYPEIELVVGNIATPEGALALIKAGTDVIKVGIGPGSICTTRVVTGCGMAQITAISQCVAAAKMTNTPVIADGGIKFSGDLTKAMVAGADSVMIGSLFAGTDEAPGETVIYQGRTYKTYRGMGSIGAMKTGSADRYFQDPSSKSKLVPEGIEGQVQYRGSLSGVVHQLMGGLRAGMGLAGCQSIEDLKTKAKFVQITSAGLTESHPHDVVITKESPNYRLD
ncbi:MAG: IMP dehydrogenase [Acidobacteria bacterium CG_4_9_14_3_um_filter_49_7]|nr:MAG: IMP dehydrogenase [Acidobacteria bacterium CG_4_9_14_3_um_filter_49_7]